MDRTVSAFALNVSSSGRYPSPGQIRRFLSPWFLTCHIP